MEQNIAVRANIQRLQSILERHPDAFHGDNDYCPLKHSFADGIYVREIFIPAGTVVVGKIHKHTHPNFLLKGRVIVVTEEGRKELVAPMSMISPAGTKRAVHAIEDSTWVTVHVNEDNGQDLKVIEDRIIAKNFHEIGLKDPQLEGMLT